MKKYPEFKQYNPAEIEKSILNYWQENQIFDKSISTREGKENFVFYEGPPSANGMPGIHHVMARTIKDIFCRFKTLTGHQVHRKAGWDTHGLPVELQVEKTLGITKDDIGKKISVEEYNQKNRETVMQYTQEWEKLTDIMGYWVDMENPYITYENEYIETVWYLLKKLYDKKLLYKGYTIQPFSPKAGTGLSTHELNQPGCYRDVSDTSAIAQFEVINNEKSAFLFEKLEKTEKNTEKTFILAWTTTPWTLPANTALAVGKNITYIHLRTFNPYTFLPITIILAKDLLGKYFTEKASETALSDYKQGDKIIPYEIIAEYKGEQLNGVSYHQLMPYVQPEKPAFRVILGDFVSTTDGTGIVHIAPTFGSDDFRVAQQNDIPAIMVKDENGKDMPIVNRQGRYVAEITDFANRYVKAEYENDEILADKNYKSTDVLICIKLKEENKAFKVEKYVHSYPHCWRTDKPILYYPLDSWFIKTTAYKDKLVELNKKINWKPESTGTGRFGNWLENMVDWNLSRQRYWGTPLPIWRSEDELEELCIGGVAQLSEEVEKAIKAGFMKENLFLPSGEGQGVGFDSKYDLHRPFIDDVILVSPTGKKMYRQTDLIDVWFDSGAMPYAQLGYPYKEGSEELFKKGFPADFISEGVDQTRGWFFTLHTIAGMLFDDIAFKNVVSTGLVLDKEGVKMSKRLGNVINPFETIEKYGADATRWYMISNANPWDNLKFNISGVEETKRGFFGTLFNTYNFFAIYANIDNFDPKTTKIDVSELPELDRWIISKLETLKKEVVEAYQQYEPTRATRLIEDFVNDNLSNWHVRLSRKRFWKGEMTSDKISAYQTLAKCLENVAQLMSPVAPFFADFLYQNITQTQNSVHLSYISQINYDLIDEDLEIRMKLAQNISSLTHSLRKKAVIRTRLPLSRVLVPVLNEKTKKQIQAVTDIILSEVNVKKLEIITDDAGILVKSIKPNFKTLGAKYKQQMKDVANLITQMTTTQIAEIEKNNQIILNNEALGDFEITLDDVLISSQDVQGYAVAREGDLTVALDIQLDDNLIKEGLARDFVNRIQNLRKDTGFDVQDKIYLVIEQKNDLMNQAIQTHKEYIMTEVQCISLEFGENTQIPLEIEEYQFSVNIERK
jgi:isoleucyl-tRNA synthetase